MRENKNLVGGGYCRRTFSSVGMNKTLAHVGTPIFSWWGLPIMSKLLSEIEILYFGK